MATRMEKNIRDSVRRGDRTDRERTKGEQYRAIECGRKRGRKRVERERESRREGERNGRRDEGNGVEKHFQGSELK